MIDEGSLFPNFMRLLGRGGLTANMNLTRDKKTGVTAARFSENHHFGDFWKKGGTN